METCKVILKEENVKRELELVPIKPEKKTAIEAGDDELEVEEEKD